MNEKDFEALYKNTFNEIQINNELLSKIENTSVNNKPKFNMYNFKSISVIAACLAVIFVVTSLFAGNGNKENSFIIKAGATEIGSGTYSKIADLFPLGSYNLGVNDENGSTGEGYFSKTCPFTVYCEGDNIKSVKYTIENGVFVFPLDARAKQYREDFPKIAKLSDSAYNRIETTQPVQTGFEEKQYSSYTINYEEQKSVEKIDNIHHYPIVLSAGIDYKNLTGLPEDAGDFSMDDEDAIKLILEEETIECNQIFSKVRITVEVTFEDGTTKSETFKLSCTDWNMETGISIDAMLVS